MDFQLTVKGHYVSRCGKYQIFQEGRACWKLFVYVKVLHQGRYTKYVSMEVTQSFHNPTAAKAVADRMENMNGRELSDCNSGG